MSCRNLCLLAVTSLYTAPALAEPVLADKTFLGKDFNITRPAPKTIASFKLRHLPVAPLRVLPVDEIAVSVERTDTRFQRFNAIASRSLEKVFPGHPRSAIVSIGLRYNF